MHKTSQSILSSFMAIPRYLSLKYILSSNAFIIILLNASFITPASSQLGLLETSLEPTMPSGYYKQRLTQSSLVNKLRLVEAFKEKSMEKGISKSLSLEECINLAFQYNPEVQGQIALLEAKRNTLRAAYRSWNPTISVDSASSTISNNGTYEGNRSQTFDADQFNFAPITRSYESRDSQSLNNQFSGNIQWTFLDFSRQPNINSELAGYSAQRFGFYSVSRDIVNQIQVSYYSLLAQRDLIHSFEVMVEALKDNAEAIDSKFAAGRANLQDVGQSYAQFYNTLSQLTRYIEDYYATSAKLAELVSLPEDTLIIASDPNQFKGKWNLNREQSISSVRLNNDRVLQALQLSKRSKWSGTSLLNKTLPQLYLSSRASYNTTNTTLSSTTSTRQYNSSQANARAYSQNLRITNRSAYDINAMVGFRWFFYQGGVNRANAAAQFSQSQYQVFEADRLKQSFTANVLSNINSLEANKLQYTSSNAAAESSQISYIAAMARLKAGLTDVTAINQVVQLYQTAIQAKARSIQNYNVALANLHRDTAIWPREAQGLASRLLKATGLE